MIICAGESLIDMVSSSEQKGEAQYTPHVGGSILNSARASGLCIRFIARVNSAEIVPPTP